MMPNEELMQTKLWFNIFLFKHIPSLYKVVKNVIVLWVVSLCVLLFIMQSNYKQSVSKFEQVCKQELVSNNMLLSRSLHNTFSHTIEMLHLIANRIKSTNTTHEINQIVQGFHPFGCDVNMLSWSHIGWVDPQLRLISDSSLPVMERPLDLSHREYVLSTLKNPNEIQLGEVVTGLISGLVFLPLSMSVYTDDNKLKGILVCGFILREVRKNLSQLRTSDKINYYIYNKKNQLIISNTIAKKQTTADNISFIEYVNDEKLDSSMKGMRYISKFAHFPYYIVVDYDKTYIDSYTNELFIENVWLTSGVILLFFIFYFISFVSFRKMKLKKTGSK